MINSKKFLSVFFAAMIMISSAVIPAFAEISTKEFDINEIAENAAKAKESEENYQVLICANKGDWQDFPENSAEAVSGSCGDFVSVDIRVTSDKIPVLMEDETLDRMCVTNSGKAVSGKVSDYTYEEIQKYFLREKNGGPHNKKTDYKVAALSDVVADITDKRLILDFELSDLEAVESVISSSILRSKVVYRINCKAEDAVEALSKKEAVPETIVKYDGNIIFGVNNTIKIAKESGLNMVQIGDKNQYGVIFYQSVENKIKDNKLTAVFSMTDGYNGKRTDNISGWEDVISHGYSVIETDYPELLSTYINQSETVRLRLNSLIDKKSEYENGTYPKNLKEEYDNAYKEAVSVSKSVASQSQLAQSFIRLNKACNALNLSEGTSTQQSALKISAGRIIAAVLCLAAVVAAQIFFYKRRKA